MLTGDHLLTSIATFKELKLSQKEFLTIESQENKLIGKDEKDQIISEENWKNYELCIDGYSL